MAKVALSKSALSQQSQQLKSYQQFLPSLDMKRKQLMGERARALAERRALEAELEALRQRVAETLPMLANQELDLSGLVKIEHVELGRENRMGTWLPTLAGLEIAVRPYGYLSKPHWVESLVAALREAARLRIELMLAEQRVDAAGSGGAHRYPARQPVRQGADPADPHQHQAHPHRALGCRAGGGGALEDR